MEQNSKTLIQHIQEFRRKFYVNKIIRGSIFLLLITSSLLFVGVLGEGILGFSSGVRTGFMAVMGIAFAAVLGVMILWPASKLVNITQSISDVEIAQLVRKHFPNINDKLLNLLELQSSAESQGNELLKAAIQKKTDELAPVPFAKAVNFKVNWKYARYLAIPAVLFLLFALINPSMLTDGTTRLVNFNKEYEKPAPFQIQIQNHPNNLISGESYTLETKTGGDVLPQELQIYLKKEGETEFLAYPMDRDPKKKNEFTFRFRDVKEGFTYFVGNEEVSTSDYATDVMKRPSIRNFQVILDYPNYTGMATDTLSENVGDFKVIRGTKATWNLQANGDIERAVYVGADTTPFKLESDQFAYGKSLKDDEAYFISLTSPQKIQNNDTVKYKIDVVADRYPAIYMKSSNGEFMADFTMTMPLNFEISDDYGFTGLTLFYRYTESGKNPDKVSQTYSKLPLDFSRRSNLQEKDMEVDLSMLDMLEGDKVEYYVSVWDNDMVAGPKSSKTSVYRINYTSLDEKFEEVGKREEDIDKQVDKTMKDIKELQDRIQKIQDKLLDQKSLSFDDQKAVEEMIKQQKDVRSQMQEIQKMFEKNKSTLENNQMISENTLKKYEQLNKFLQEIDNPKLDELMERLHNELDEMDPEELAEAMEEMEMNEEELEDAIERTEELVNQLEAERMTEEVRQKLENLKDQQEMLNEKLQDAETEEEMEKIAEQQEELKEKMEEIKEDLKELADKKEETQTPGKEEMSDLQQDADDAKENMEEAGEQIQQDQKDSGSDSQQNASDKMQEMIDQLNAMQMSGNMQQDQMNLDNLREILENLLTMSFDQEDLRDEVKELTYRDPQMTNKETAQKRLIDDMEMVKDSLDELAKKVFQIEKYVIDESRAIIKSMNGARQQLENKNLPKITEEQQRAMTHTNNLANMLSEVMDQMQQQMKNQQPGMGKCQKPGGSKPNLGKMGQEQKQLGEQMGREMKKGLGKGQNGLTPAQAKALAAKQAAIRKALEEAKQQMEQEGGKSLGDLGEIIKDMKNQEQQLQANDINPDILERQQRILNRLLDANKAVREKNEYDNKRESQTGKEQDRKSPEDLTMEEYKNRIRQELLKSNQLEYSDDFIILIENYFNLLQNSAE